MTDTMLTTHPFTLRSPSGQCLFKQMSLSFRTGQCWAILGENGVGKSCLLRALAGFDDELNQVIFLKDKALLEYSAKTLAQQRSWLPQRTHFPETLSVMDLLLSYRYPHRAFWQMKDSEQDRQQAFNLAQSMGFTDKLDHCLSQLSAGQQQQVALAAMWMQDTPLILLDEPTAYMDIAHQHQNLSDMRQRCQDHQKTVIIALQDPNLALYYCTHVLCLFKEDKKSKESFFMAGKACDLLTAENLSRLYRYPVLTFNDPAGRFLVPQRMGS